MPPVIHPSHLQTWSRHRLHDLALGEAELLIRQAESDLARERRALRQVRWAAMWNAVRTLSRADRSRITP
ncbi:hypothetical protein [Wenxinia marina]|uniref:Uncharacterized protein n=1 Tax=Wenxinia marina DSM 24838 TaxID=1123501 RepID=A0A0D0QFM4_9RHOB|nr:hypothetical protein [Wenxinia marina]KIQ71092.1 hypothetical protein Wenmar_00470 [Wenxinia marina DSM 24838]GGL54884.1 hypothetical protein GCM10011392_06640 [Wenxinia marina]